MVYCSCKDCIERHVGCHSTCEKYLEFLKKNEEEKKLIQEMKLQDSILHKFGVPGICCGNKVKRRTKQNRFRQFANGSC